MHRADMASAGSLTPATGSRAATDGRSSTDTAVTVVVPTRNEAGNVDALLDRLGPALAGSSAEVIFVDDSDDDTPQRVLDRAATSPPDLVVRLMHRPPGQRAGGLGTAVVAGFTAATGEWVVVMDGDLQHPPEVVPQLVERGEQSGAGIVVGSRKVEGGDDEGLSGTSRVLVSGGATLLAKVVFPRRLQGVSDPMSGFFAVRRSSLDTSRLRPDGFKILMEVLVRTPGLDPVEVGFAFQDRNAGESKASLAEGMRFARHLATLSLSRLRPARLSPRTSMTGRALAFGAVGLSGIAVNSLVMFLLADPVALGLNYLAAAIIATQVSTTWNYLLTDRLVYGGPKRLGAARRYLAFLITNNVLLLLRIPVLALLVGSLGMHYLAANLLTLVLTFIARFATSDRLIFHKGATS